MNNEEGLALGQKIRELRLMRKMSADDLALEADIDRSTVYRIEKAELIITADLLFSLAKALQVKPMEMLDFDDASSSS